MASNDPDAAAGPEPDLDGAWPLVGRDGQVAAAVGGLEGGQARAGVL